MARKVVLDEECCIGCGSCRAVSEIFEMDEEAELAHLILPEGGDVLASRSHRYLPVRVIAWED
jgi:ferredoxin